MIPLSNRALEKAQRTQLEAIVKAAREVDQNGAIAALGQLAVAEAKVPDCLTDVLRSLRCRLRAPAAAGKFEGWPDQLQDFKLLDRINGHHLTSDEKRTAHTKTKEGD